jgi:nucleotide-binding universal stress UspA family protein
MIQVKKILYPTDFSPFSTPAYFHAVGLAEAYKASLTIVYAFTPGKEGQTPADRDYWRTQLESIRPTNPKIPVSHVLLEGHPAAEIVKFAADAGINIIVMGTHGRTGVERQLMGSVAEQVMREATCSVMVVKLPKGQPATARPNAELAGQA